MIGNKSASGTEILDELGEEQLKSGALIVYTSADSVLQIAASEETIGLEELYRCCEIARELTLEDRWKVGRVIARPYVGKAKGSFRRTPHRKDYALAPFEPTDLEVLKDSGKDVIGVGKIGARLDRVPSFGQFCAGDGTDQGTFEEGFFRVVFYQSGGF